MGFHHCYDDLDEEDRLAASLEIAGTLKVSSLKVMLTDIIKLIKDETERVHAARRRKMAQKKEAKRQKLDASDAEESFEDDYGSSEDDFGSSDDSGVSYMDYSSSGDDGLPSDKLLQPDESSSSNNEDGTKE